MNDTAAMPADQPDLVVVVPGIRDRGIAWHAVEDELRQAGFMVQVVGWDEYFGALPFLVPAPWFRRIAIKKLEYKVLDAIQTHSKNGIPPRVSFIAHSFGSYILCHLLRRSYHIKSHRIILCGSVLSRNFKFSSFEERFCGPILNDVGCKDYWPLIASSVTFGYGSIGTFGYFGSPVTDRFHREANHGSFGKPGFCTKYWIPFLREKGPNGLVKGDVPIDASSSKRSTVRTFQHVKWLILVVITYVAVAGGSHLYCRPQLQAVDSLTWANSLAWIHSAVSFETSRLKRQTESVCRYLPVEWPKPVTVVHFDKKLERIAACGDRASVSTARPSAIDALISIQRAFPGCFEMIFNAARSTVDIHVTPDSGSQQTVDLGSKELEWILCSCDDAGVRTLRSQRLGPNN